MLKLVGSVPSPYVRRLRLWLDGVDYQFSPLDIYSPEGRAELEKYNPAMKIPMLLDGEQPVYDSGAIFRYLSEKLNRPALTVAQQNQLTLVDAFQDALILLFYAERSGLEPQQDSMICSLQNDRLARLLPLLSEQVAAGEFDGWSYPAISLYTVLDWADFRQRMSLADWPVLQAFRDAHQQQAQVAATDPRQLAS